MNDPLDFLLSSPPSLAQSPTNPFPPGPSHEHFNFLLSESARLTLNSDGLPDRLAKTLAEAASDGAEWARSNPARFTLVCEEALREDLQDFQEHQQQVTACCPVEPTERAPAVVKPLSEDEARALASRRVALLERQRKAARKGGEAK